MRGVVVRLDLDGKFGFIEGEDGREFFFHLTGLLSSASSPRAARLSSRSRKGSLAMSRANTRGPYTCNWENMRCRSSGTSLCRLRSSSSRYQAVLSRHISVDGG